MKFDYQVSSVLNAILTEINKHENFDSLNIDFKGLHYEGYNGWNDRIRLHRKTNNHKKEEHSIHILFDGKIKYFYRNESNNMYPALEYDYKNTPEDLAIFIPKFLSK